MHIHANSEGAQTNDRLFGVFMFEVISAPIVWVAKQTIVCLGYLRLKSYRHEFRGWPNKRSFVWGILI